MSKQKTASKKGADIIKKLLNDAVAAWLKVERCIERKDILGMHEAALEHIGYAEKYIVESRAFPAYLGRPNAKELVYNKVFEHMQIKIGFTKEGWFVLKIPALLPKKNEGSPTCIRDAAAEAMRRFFNGKNPVRYEYCTLIYRHMYRSDRPKRQYRDHDNIEQKAVTDIINLYVLRDDSALRCKHYYSSEPGTEDETQVFVVPQNEFKSWLDSVENSKNEVILFNENPI